MRNFVEQLWGISMSGIRAPPQPRQALFGDHLGDAGPVQPEAFGRERGRDLVDRVTLGAQLDDPAPGGVLGWRAWAPVWR